MSQHTEAIGARTALQAKDSETGAAEQKLVKAIAFNDQQKRQSPLELFVKGQKLYEHGTPVSLRNATHLGTFCKGDDMVGLKRAFVYAGAPTVIAGLWAVDDKSTSYLMRVFYSHLKSGMSKQSRCERLSQRRARSIHICTIGPRLF